jgi:COPI associated protein
MSNPYAAAASIGLTPTNMQEAKEFAAQQAGEFRRNLDEGSLSLRLMALLGGVAMMAVSGLGIIGDVFTFRWFAVIFQVYAMVFGCVMLVLESGRQLSCFQRWETGLYKQAKFLRLVWGRGLIYFFAGTLMISFGDFFDVVVGLYVCLVGLIFILVGRTTEKKLTDLRRTVVSTAELQEKFALADADGKGSLNLDQFGVLIHSLGLDLTRREVESTFMQFGVLRISYEIFMQWWNDEAIASDDFHGTLAAAF